ncbi:hypothetical protein VPNG_10330 [Cytospora leucostoma]|uniref:Uncharacterized protein n=1 Tax=Cytospora leucostoma TaxID=1230097 RepID=A0A423VBN7_9PEZI|nr:hypothetical protein VPNG_10330 [Cytospora leucostoma]
MLNVLFAIAALIAALVTALLSIFFTHDTDIPPHQASSDSKLDWDSPAGHICVAHLANIAVTGSPQVAGARAMTSMIHEVLNLTLSTYPFVPVRGLVTGTPTQRKDAERLVLGSWLSECEKLNRHDHANDRRDADDLNLRLRAADLAADVFIDPDARMEYLLVHWPRMAKAGGGGGGLGAPLDNKARTRMVREMDQ